jgi:hypothetical protein
MIHGLLSKISFHFRSIILNEHLSKINTLNSLFIIEDLIYLFTHSNLFCTPKSG